MITTLVILCFAINFTSAAGYFLGILVASILVVAMPIGARNLVNLECEAADVVPVFAGAKTVLSVVITNTRNRSRCDVEFSFSKAPGAEAMIIDVPPMGSATLRLPLEAKIRGLHTVPRIRVRTTFPLGLVSVSAFWQPDVFGVVYCSPEVDVPSFESVGSIGSGGGHILLDEAIEFAGVRQYRQGDRLRHLAWRQIARFGEIGDGVLFSKAFEAPSGRTRLITDSTIDASLLYEDKLSRITAWLSESEQAGYLYGVKFGTVDIELGQGSVHLDRCLREIALLPAEASL